MSEAAVLFFCRTPLQAMIVNKLSRQLPEQTVVVYHAINSSEKHRYYFDEIEVEQKYFIPWRAIRGSDTFSDMRAWWGIPRHVRNTRYTALFIASIGSFAFSLFAARSPEADIHTFDDGTFNLSRSEFEPWIHMEPTTRRTGQTDVRRTKQP